MLRLCTVLNGRNAVGQCCGELGILYIWERLLIGMYATDTVTHIKIQIRLHCR